MVFNRFFRLLQEELLSELPAAADIDLEGRNASRTIVIRTPADILYPRILLEPFYEDYLRGTSVGRISGRILGIYLSETLRPLCNPEDVADRECFLRGLRLRPVSKRFFGRMSQTLPHASWNGILFFYTLTLPEQAGRLGSALVTEELMRRFRPAGTDVFRTAIRNMKQEMPAVIMPLSRFLDHLAGDGKGGKSRFTLRAETANNGCFHVLTNEKAELGACSILYPDVPGMLHERFGLYYLLPSSVHEFLILPRGSSENMPELKRLICEVNRSSCDSLEILSDELYAYEPEKGLFVC